MVSMPAAGPSPPLVLDSCTLTQSFMRPLFQDRCCGPQSWVMSGMQYWRPPDGSLNGMTVLPPGSFWRKAAAPRLSANPRTPLSVPK